MASFWLFKTLTAPLALAAALTVHGAELLVDGGFESGGLDAWPTNFGLAGVSAPVHSGAYAVQITVFPGPSAYVAQSLGAKLVVGESYVFSGWVYLSDTNLPPMPMYGPRIRVSSSATLATALTGGESAALNLPSLVVGWNLLQFTRAFTAEELAAPVYFGAIRVGGPGDYVFDDLSVSGVMATPGNPLLSLALTPTNSAILTWPTSTRGFYLQENSSLLPGGWISNGVTPVVTGQLNQVTVPLTPGSRFYRLAQPGT